MCVWGGGGRERERGKKESEEVEERQWRRSEGGKREKEAIGAQQLEERRGHPTPPRISTSFSSSDAASADMRALQAGLDVACPRAASASSE